jgi:hypothetical protein
MATTTNYGWTTPDDTALVKDGAAAIRTLGSSVDTTVKALSPGTTAGDIDYYTTSTAKTRLGIGTAGQVLTVNGGGTAPSWASPGGALTLSQIATGNITSGTSLNISSLTQDFIELHISGVTWATGDSTLLVRPNGSSSAVYELVGASNNAAASPTATYTTSGTEIPLTSGASQMYTSAINLYILTLTNCKATGFTTYEWNARFRDSSTNTATSLGRGIFKSAAQITSLTIVNGAGYTFNGTGTYTVFGG